MPESFTVDQREQLERAYEKAIGTIIVPGYRRLLSYMRESYLPAARTSAGMSQLPGGADWYAFLVKVHTTTELSPQEIHQVGKREVTRILGEIRRMERHLGQRPASPPNSASSLLIESYRQLRSVVEPRLPGLFMTLPRSDFEISPVEPFRRESAPGASYMPGLIDGSRPGRFYVNATVESRGMASEALFLHEATPGHHFQIALQRERTDLPRFRRFGTVTAFSEGWALYAESLGQQLGLYRDPPQRLRALRSELFRARRLVVDTGIHALGWSREQAIDYLGSAREVDRYIAWPAQALAYKMGELRISALRERAEKRLGRRFDIRAFHEVVLREGALPLDTLERRIDAWISEQEE
jgi:uncharacterized protein (DUF885 family)